MKVVIIGEYLSENIGDQCIHYCMRKLISPIGNPKSLDYSGREIKCKGLRRYFLRLVLLVRTLKNSDFVIIGGGQLILGNKYFYRNAILFKLANYLINKPYIIAFCGVGKKFSLIERISFYLLIKGAKSVVLRDYESLENLKANFFLDGIVFADVVSISESDLDTIDNNDTILITPIYAGAYQRYEDEVQGIYSIEGFTKYCVDIITSSECKNVIISNTDPIDASACQKLKLTLQDKIPEITVDVKINNNLDAFKRIRPETVITSRMHAGIIFEQSARCVNYYPFSEKLKSISTAKTLSKKIRSEYREAFSKIVKKSVR